LQLKSICREAKEEQFIYKGETMSKLRGQAWIYTLFIAFIGLIVALNLIPSIADQVNLSQAAKNSSGSLIFQTGDMATTMMDMIPWIFVVSVIIAMMIMLNPFNNPNNGNQ
jgi:hypothetical protein